MTSHKSFWENKRLATEKLSKRQPVSYEKIREQILRLHGQSKPNQESSKNIEVGHDRYHKEALYYLSKAREILEKTGKDGDFYIDIKRVKEAAGVAYAGVEIAAKWYIQQFYPDAVIIYRSSVERYLNVINHNALNLFVAAWDALHKGSYYIARGEVDLVDISINVAEKFIVSLRQDMGAVGKNNEIKEAGNNKKLGII